MTIRLLALLLFYCIVLRQVFSIILDVESLEKAVEIEVLKVVRAERKLSNNQVNVFVLEL